MATIKAYSDLEQSRKLATILPLESADMWWSWYSDPVLNNGHYDDFPMFYKPVCNPDESVPCWSLASLLGVLPYPHIEQNYKGKWICRVEYENTTYLWEDSNPVDACVAMIERLHELKML